MDCGTSCARDRRPLGTGRWWIGCGMWLRLFGRFRTGLCPRLSLSRLRTRLLRTSKCSTSPTCSKTSTRNSSRTSIWTTPFSSSNSKTSNTISCRRWSNNFQTSPVQKYLLNPKVSSNWDTSFPRLPSTYRRTAFASSRIKTKTNRAELNKLEMVWVLARAKSMMRLKT
jgi:hypothetical protein